MHWNAKKKNAVQLPVKTLQEKTAEQSKHLRIQFPVSSGQQHRKTENEWVPVSPKKDSTCKALVPLKGAPSLPAQASSPPIETSVFPVAENNENLDIGSIVSQRLTAMRKLQENPHDVQALNEMYKAQKSMQNWAESKQQPGMFTGTTGVKVLSAAELSSGFQAWAKKDQLKDATPVNGGMGMTLLQKMGWRPGEGLGKNKEGSLIPLQLEVKMDKKGLVSQEELHPRPVMPVPVRVNGVEYKPSVASPNKKQAKAEAATISLRTLGVLPP
uniref:(California timema) hypothetical protein n=1 Tax=Timema californicum TaxID=61474 RepID=A0A7R9IYZ5_TIMCA|nr:unnamed protein product [Timema californicum]